MIPRAWQRCWSITISWAAWVVVIALDGVNAEPAAVVAPPTNVVFILSDDQHWRDYAFMGHPHLRTPHLDRLARESLVFTRGYVTSSLCAPSLATVITGRYPHEHRVVGNDPPGGKEAFEAGRERMSRHLEEWPTLPRLLAARGYASLQTGKWWQGDFSRGGFTEGMTKGTRHGDEGLSIGRNSMQPIYDFIGRCRTAGKPFFVWYAPMLPHDPHDPAPELVEHYRSQTDSVHVARYWGNVERFDRTVGDLLDHLDRENLSANTLVVYVTDNGWIQSPDNSRFAPKSKLSPYDGGLRTPIMLRRPGTIRPGTSDALASAIDILPTVLAACGVAPPAGLPGLNLLDETAVGKRRQVFGECYTHKLIDLDDPAKSLVWRWTVRDHWKLVVPATADGGPVELFDVVADPDETRNLAAAEPARVAELQATLDAWWNPAGPAQAARRAPNFIVFLADDLGAHDLGCTGSTFHRSPAIDRLAADGMLFTHGYAAAPVCSPTRAALVTGRHPARVRITNFIAGDRRGSLLPADYLKALPAGEVTVPERLREQGYATGVFGKWHLGPPADIATHGFEVTGSTTVGPGSGPRDDPMHAKAIAAEAAAFIESNRDRPFFCYVSMHSVHVPLITRPELAAEEGKRAVGVGPRFDVPPPVPGDPATRQVQNHPVYSGMIREMDETVATVLAAVEKSGRKADTLVVFTSDNGGLSTAEGAPTSNLPLRAGKGFVYEGGIRVPLIVRWPGVVKAGATSDVPVTTLDVAATLLDAAGAPARADAPLDGTSLRPVLSRSGTIPPRDLVWHYPHYSNQGGRPAAALLAGDSPKGAREKLVEHFEGGRVELFDLESDPGERQDLASTRPERVRALEARLDAWRQSVSVALPRANPQPVDPFGPEAEPARADAAPPNVVVILADDLGFSDLGCYGGEIDTPHLDRLAAGGLRFTQGYNTARCWPTRAALLTGYYAQSVRRDSLPGGKGGTGGERPPWARLLPELLAPAGYVSYHSGKWHVDGDPRKQGFVRSLDVSGAGQSNYFDPGGITEDGQPIAGNDGFYTTTAIGDHAVKCLREHRAERAGAPFYHYVPFTAPHFPLQAPPELVAKYCDRYRAGWDTVRRARCERVRQMGLVTSPAAEPERDVGPPYQPKPETLARLGAGEVDRPLPWNDLTGAQQQFQAEKMAIHAAMIEAMDREVGRIVAELEAMGALANTLILFASDNGASAEIMVRGEGHDPAAAPGSRKTFLCLGPGWSSCANAPFRRHKTWVHEGGLATPWIVHWPAGIAARGELRTQPVHVIDVVPTVLELTGIAPPTEQAGVSVPAFQGRSFAKALADPAAPAAHDALWWCHEGNRAVRVGDWKLVAARNTSWELYDLATDRCETKNLAGVEQGRVQALEAEWNRISEECRALAADDQPPRKARAKRPNIIYVMTDDQGYGDIGAQGNPVVKTPHLDRMHAESVRLTEFHASPTCSPTRAALMTGRHEFRSGVTHTILERERLALPATTLPQLLKTAGYTTGIFGKWHLGDEDDYQPGKRGFDRVFIHGGGGIGQSYPGSCGDVPGNTYFDPMIRSDGRFVRTKGYCTDVFFDAALEWIDARRKQEQPFFCYLTPNSPHDPLDCPPGSDTPYLAKLEAAGITDATQRGRIAKFYGMIGNIDTNVGRLFAKLDEWGLAEDTLVVFTTDNGTATGAAVFNDGMRGQKGSPWRGGTRVPSYWRWKGSLPSGMDMPSLVAHIDVLPTLCALADVEIPPTIAAKVEGRNFAPLLRGARIAWPDRPLITHVGRWDRGKAAESAYRNCRIREGRWSLVNVKNRPDAWELYDLSADPGEKIDVAKEHPDVLKQLAATYDAWWASVQPDLVNENLDGPVENPFKVAFARQFGPAPTLFDVPYGPHPKQRIHFWKSPKASAEKPVPLLFFVHGGGWVGGDRLSGLATMLPKLLEAGVSVASAEYRFIKEAMDEGVDPPVKAPLSDAARALQTVRSKAAEWQLDPMRVAASGGSAGACTSLWLAFHDDMADPKSGDPVARWSTRLLAVAVTGAQTTLDPVQMKAWIPNSRYGGHAFGFMTSPENRDSRFAEFLAARDRLLPVIGLYSPYALASADDPPVYLNYRSPPALGEPQSDPTHSANFGVKLKERLDGLGVPCELVYPGAPDVRHPTVAEFLIDVLTTSR